MLMNMRAVGRSSAAFVPNRIAFRPKVALRTNRVVDFRLINTAPPKKTWTAASCLDDHAEVFKSLPAILGAYIGPNSLPPQLGERIAVRSRIARCAALHAGHVVMHACWGAGESIMVAVNSSNACPYCEGLHGELVRTSTRARARVRARTQPPTQARMAGVKGSAQLQAAKSVADCTAVVDDPAVAFARTFAEGNGRGEVRRWPRTRVQLNAVI